MLRGKASLPTRNLDILFVSSRDLDRRARRSPLAHPKLAILLALTLAMVTAEPSVKDCLAVSSVTVSPTTYTLGDVATPVTVQADTAAPANELIFDIFIDTGGDGMIHAEDGWFMSFAVEDGHAARLGNSWFWHDVDGAPNSSVRATLVANGSWRFSGDFIAKVTDEDSSWATASFSVAQDSSYPCVVTGEVQMGGSSAGGAIVGMMDFAAEAMVSMDMADVDGKFELRVASPGGYIVLALKPDSVTNYDQGSSQMIQVSEGSNPLPTPLVLFPGNRTISGRVFASDTGKGFRGTLVSGEGEDGEGLLSVGATDNDGNYTLTVTDGEWEILLSEDLSRLGYVMPYSWVSVSGSNATGIDLSCPKATTLVTGTVKDAQTQEGLQGILVWADLEYDGTESVGCSGPDGSYAIGVVEGVWYVEIEQEGLYGTGYAAPPGQQVTAPASGTVSGVDFLLEKQEQFRILAVRWSIVPGALELHWSPRTGSTHRVYWHPGPLGHGMTWHEVPNAQDDIRQEGDTMIWTDKGSAPGMSGMLPGDPDVRQRFYRVEEMTQ